METRARRRVPRAGARDVAGAFSRHGDAAAFHDLRGDGVRRAWFLVARQPRGADDRGAHALRRRGVLQRVFLRARHEALRVKRGGVETKRDARCLFFPGCRVRGFLLIEPALLGGALRGCGAVHGAALHLRAVVLSERAASVPRGVRRPSARRARTARAHKQNPATRASAAVVHARFVHRARGWRPAVRRGVHRAFFHLVQHVAPPGVLRVRYPVLSVVHRAGDVRGGGDRAVLLPAVLRGLRVVVARVFKLGLLRAVRVHVQRVVLLRQPGDFKSHPVDHVLRVHGAGQRRVRRRDGLGGFPRVLRVLPSHLRKRQDRLTPLERSRGGVRDE
mmetsp:Transcript_1494/g.6024  ORF Transcript_1494/g.6024 Transcript_1494/m.6024 type:complete len:333 (-) Transcript_1494:56-1054(-)